MVENAEDSNPGPVATSRADGAPLVCTCLRMHHSKKIDLNRKLALNFFAISIQPNPPYLVTADLRRIKVGQELKK